jgi:ABC-type transporter Mla subunit MlaD
MTEDVFRIVVSAGVGVAALAFVVQACVVIAFYRGTKKTQQRLMAFAEKAEPLVAKIEPVLDQAAPVVEKVGATVERLGPVIDEIRPALQKAGPALERIGPAADKVGEMVDKAKGILVTANRIMEDTRPKIAQLSAETVAIARSGRDQVERLGDLLHDASDRARNRLEQIDQTVENTVGQVEHAGDTVKRAVMRPVREVNGIAAGISAAVSTLVHGSRKSSVDAATQDEEMFI